MGVSCYFEPVSVVCVGVGVDDMFVIVSAWTNLPSAHQKLPVQEKIAHTLKNAGVSITVTSITDIVAFGIGGSTVSILTLYPICSFQNLSLNLLERIIN